MRACVPACLRACVRTFCRPTAYIFPKCPSMFIKKLQTTVPNKRVHFYLRDIYGNCKNRRFTDPPFLVAPTNTASSIGQASRHCPSKPGQNSTSGLSEQAIG